MANPSYSLNNISFTTLPGAYRYGGRPRSKVIEDINFESDSGVEFNYVLFEKKMWELVFRVTTAQLATFDALYEAVYGRNTPFYFSPTGAGVSDSVPVKMQDNHFDPQELDGPGSGAPMFDFVLRLKQAIL